VGVGTLSEESKERLKRLTLMAIDRYNNNEAFTMEEVNAYFGAVKEAFGDSEASGVLNFVLDAIKRHGYENLDRNFGRAMVVAIGESKKAKGKTT
jgi:hypothetical protein